MRIAKRITAASLSMMLICLCVFTSPREATKLASKTAATDTEASVTLQETVDEAEEPTADTEAMSEDIATDETEVDTDGDGLTDREETLRGTDALTADSDGDGARDGYEVTLGTDPVSPDETFSVTCSHRGDDATVGVVVEAILKGAQAESLSIFPTATAELFPETMPGYLVEAYDLTVDGEPETATLSFVMDTVSAVSQPTIYYFSEAEQTLVPLETTVEGPVASASVDAAATYVLLDRTLYEGALTWEDTWGVSEVYTALEVVFVIDDSGSMLLTDADNRRLSLAQDLVDCLAENSKIGVVRFSSMVEILTPQLTADKEAAKAYLSTDCFKSDGGTNMYTAVHSALALFESDDPHTQKVMVVLSDGLSVDTHSYDEIVSTALNDGIRLYTIGLDDSAGYFSKNLETFAQDVGGLYYYADNADELVIAYDAIGKLIDLTTDTDGDTIPDYYEDNLIAFNGVQIPLDKTRADTDYDGIPDNEEVSVELVYSEDGAQVYVKGVLLSDPTLSDTDGDGTQDGTDEAPYDNSFSGTLTTEYAASTVSFEMDYNRFFADNTVYHTGLSKISVLFSSLAYAENSLAVSDALSVRTSTATTAAQLLEYFGMQNPQSYSLSDHYDDIHLSEVTVGYRNTVINGEMKTVLAVVVRGTNKTIEEWSSNCDIGDLSTDTDSDDWKNTDNHKGFDIAANRIMTFVEQYIEESGLYEDSLVYWVTGHSRGAGIANILGANLEKAGKTAFTYTFAAPNTTLTADAASYTTIFNIVNTDDFVPCLPIDQWGYTRYGVSTTAVSIRESYETVWESFTGISDYNSDGNNMEACVEALGGIMTAGSDPRVDGYTYTCACHGDGSNDTVTIKNAGTSESSRDKAIAKIPANALPYCTITTYEGGLISGWDFEVCQTPAYFMQLLAAFMGGEINAYRFAVELNIADRYENAKTALIAVGISGVEHPHYTETYYVLADNITAADFG